MAFPTIAPTGRQYDAGDWPVKEFTAQDGAEVRILYGNRRVGHTLNLEYKNITDENAESFISHYKSCKGTYQTFVLPTDAVGKGWEGSSDFFRAGLGAQWRYSGPPKIKAVYPGVSTVSFKLVAAGVGQ